MNRPIAATLAALLLAGAAQAQRDDARAARATIVRDGAGIAHIHGVTDADAVFGMIYAQAEDDFPRIERNYLTALGRLAEADGDKALWQDLRQRLYTDPAALKAAYAASPAWLRALMDAWAAGLNHYLATHPQVRPQVIRQFEPWMTLAFSEGSIGGDIERGIDPDQLKAFYGNTPAPPPAEARRIAAARFEEPKGSNGFAIGPQRSANGRALLWINPHTSFYFRAEQQVSSDEGLDAYGAATWGQFFVYQGFNRDVGWMHTSSGVDNIDEFTVEVARRDGRLAYRYGTEWRPLKTRTIDLAVRQPDGTMAIRTFTTYATHHGPVIRAENGRWVAVAMLDSPQAALEQSFLRTKTRDLASFLAVAERRANSSNNTLFAARDGTIAYLHPQFVPVRDDRFDYRRAVDGSDPATDWKGLHALADLPQAVSPKSGWVMNTNNWPYSAAGADSPRQADFPRYMDQFGENPRGIHATAVLSGTRKFTPASLTAAAYDSFLPLFDQQIPGLARGMAALAPDDPRRPRLAAPLAMLTGWDRRWSTASQPTSLAVHWGEALFKQEGPKAEAATMPLFTWLAERTTDADRVAALDTAVAGMTATFGDWRIAWGRINRLQRISGAIDQAFEDGKPSLPVGFTSGNFGSLAAFSVTRQPGQRCLYGTTGNSFVAAVEFGRQVRAWAVSVGGETNDPASPHFDDQLRPYAAGKLRAVPLTAAALKPFAGRAYHPGAARPDEGRRRTAPVPIGDGPCMAQ